MIKCLWRRDYKFAGGENSVLQIILFQTIHILILDIVEDSHYFIIVKMTMHYKQSFQAFEWFWQFKERLWQVSGKICGWMDGKETDQPARKNLLRGRTELAVKVQRQLRYESWARPTQTLVQPPWIARVRTACVCVLYLEHAEASEMQIPAGWWPCPPPVLMFRSEDRNLYLVEILSYHCRQFW